MVYFDKDENKKNDVADLNSQKWLKCTVTSTSFSRY